MSAMFWDSLMNIFSHTDKGKTLSHWVRSDLEQYSNVVKKWKISSAAFDPGLKQAHPTIPLSEWSMKGPTTRENRIATRKCHPLIKNDELLRQERLQLTWRLYVNTPGAALKWWAISDRQLRAGDDWVVNNIQQLNPIAMNCKCPHKH